MNQGLLLDIGRVDVWSCTDPPTASFDDGTPTVELLIVVGATLPNLALKTNTNVERGRREAKIGMGGERRGRYSVE